MQPWEYADREAKYERQDKNKENYNRFKEFTPPESETPEKKEEEAPMESIQPSIGAIELLATTDANVFEHVMSSIGLPILGVRDDDPLQKTALPEDIEAMASELTESADEYHDLDPYLASIKDLAEALGYIVSIAA